MVEARNICDVRTVSWCDGCRLKEFIDMKQIFAAMT